MSIEKAGAFARRKVRITQLAPRNALATTLAEIALADLDREVAKLRKRVGKSDGKRFTSKREARCALCLDPIHVGDSIVWAPKIAVHAACADGKA